MTGGVEKKFISVKSLINTANYSILEKMNLKYYTLSTIKTTLKSTFIPNHSFSILGLTNCNTTGNYDSCLFHLYNPWGSDAAVLKFVEKFIQNSSIPKNTLNILNMDKHDDGLFVLPFSVILKHFDKIISVAALDGYTTSYQLIPSKPSLKNTFNINFQLIGNDGPSFIYFETLIGEVLKSQIKPFKLIKLTSPNGESIISEQNEGERDFVYQGVFVPKSNHPYIITLNFTIEKFNFDIMKNIVLSFYSKGSVQLMTKLQEIESSCINNCSEHGKCINSSKCECDQYVPLILIKYLLCLSKAYWGSLHINRRND